MINKTAHLFFALLIGYALFLTSCSKSKEIHYAAFLELTDEMHFPLDETTSGISEFVTTYTHNGISDSIFNNEQTYLAYINQPREVQFYDMESKQLVHRINFPSQGPNSISIITAVHTQSPDSIFIASFPLPFIFRVNMKGEILERINLGPFNKTVEPISSTSKPIVVTNNHIYTGFYTLLPPTDFHSPLNPQELKEIVLDIDLKSQQQELKLNLPDSYTRDKIFSRYYYNPSLSRGKEKGEILISFGASDSITVTNFKQTNHTSYAGSELFSNINPSSKAEDSWDHYRLNYMYEGIIYDPYRNCYYRFLTLPKKEDDLKSTDMKTGRIKDIAIIILDKDFKKVGETMIDPAYSNMMYFVNEKGLNLFNIKKGLTDEDHMSFGTFELTRSDQ